MKKRILIALLVIAGLAGLGVVGGLHYASRSVEERLLRALGPESEIQEVKVGLHEVLLSGIRVKAPKGWPAETALRAERVTITPKLRELFSERMELTEIRVENAYISALRPKSGGGLRILPNLAHKAEKGEGGKRGAAIRTVTLERCTFDLYDATVPLKPQHVKIEGVAGTVKDVEIPDLSARTELDLKGVLPGPSHKGTIAVKGWVDVDKKSAELDIQVRNVDLAVFEPYLVTKAKTSVETGTFNLDLKPVVRNNVLHAKGTLTISQLKLGSPGSPGAAIAGIPGRAAAGALADDSDRITVPFTLEGDLSDPKFSVAGSTAFHAGIAIIKASGLSFEGLVRGVFLILAGLGSAFGNTAGGA